MSHGTMKCTRNAGLEKMAKIANNIPHKLFMTSLWNDIDLWKKKSDINDFILNILILVFSQ